MEFNQEVPAVMHIDLNSCFASIEQQANPLYRGRPLVVAAYKTAKGVILASSIEAKRLGIKTGMRVFEAKKVFPSTIVLETDPWKYRNVHLKLRRLLSKYTPIVQPKSIDEFVLDFRSFFPLCGIRQTALEIKQKIRKKIGDNLTVSVGIATNRLLAKLASNLKKPDGLVEINKDNFTEIYAKLKLTDLPYIKEANAIRLMSVGITTLPQFYSSPLWKLRAAFKSILGYYWHLRLKGYEVDEADWGRRSYGNSYSLPKPLATFDEISPIFAKLTTKMSSRLRSAGYMAKGVHLALHYRDGSFWHKGISMGEPIFETADIFRLGKKLFFASNTGTLKPIRNIAISVFGLVKTKTLQLGLFRDIKKRKDLSDSVDRINERWGSFVVTSASMIDTYKYVPDRIAFGGIKELEEFTNVDPISDQF